VDDMDGMDEIVEEFLVESHENLDQLDRDLVALEREPSSRELLSSVFRTLHTIKGTSGFLAFHVLESVTHVGESLLARLRDGELVLDRHITTVLLEMVDAVRAVLTRIEQTGAEGEEDYSPLVARLNAVLAGEAPESAKREISEPATSGNDRETGKRSVTDSTIRVDVDLLDSLMDLVGELVLTRNQMLQRSSTREDTDLQRATHRLNVIAAELQEGVMKTRMQQIDNAWSKLPRVVRDLSVQLGRSVELRMEGRETELDKTVLEAVRDPLTHLVRNCVDHGIEATDTRVAHGKPAHGTLVLRAFHESGQVNIEIADDGAGIDPAKVRDRAVSRGLLSRDEATALTDREAVALVFAPGFSTADAVTSVSGRGVGMDVVKTNVERIGGTVDVTSVVGRGTTVRIRIPLTLAIIPALIISCAGNHYAIPQVNLLELVRLEPEHVETVHGAAVHRLRGRLLPLVDLREQLRMPGREPGTAYVAVLRADDRHFGLVVDSIRDTEEIVVKPLGRQLRGIPLYAGATIMGDGQLALILDAMALARQAGMAPEDARTAVETGDGTPAGQRTSLLVVAVGDGRRAALPLEAVERLEELPRDRVERVAQHEVVQYRDQILPLLRLDRVLQGVPADDGTSEALQVVVCRSGGRLLGVVVADILDIVEQEVSVRSHLDTGGHGGSAVVDGQVTELVDIDRAVRTVGPELLRPVGVS